ncbi:MAG: phosphatase PAP2 family protein [Mariprofundaceae bacterium]
MSFSELNHSLFRLVNDAHNELLDGLFGLISGLGDGLVIALLCALLMLFRLRLGMAALLAFILSGLAAQLLKRIFDMPRPPAVLEHVHVLGAALQSHSFPSGHSTSDGVMVLAAFLLWSLRDWKSWLVGGLFVLAAIGRIYGGVHFPVDVLAGLLLGSGIMWVCWRISAAWPVERWQASPWSWKIVGLIVAIEAAVLGLGYQVQPSTAQPLALILPVAALLVLMQEWKARVKHD